MFIWCFEIVAIPDDYRARAYFNELGDLERDDNNIISRKNVVGYVVNAVQLARNAKKKILKIPRQYSPRRFLCIFLPYAFRVYRDGFRFPTVPKTVGRSIGKLEWLSTRRQCR